MENKKAFGHVLAIFTIFIWGTTFYFYKNFAPGIFSQQRFYFSVLSWALFYCGL